MNFKKIKEQNKAVIYKESKTKLTETDWEFWGKRITDSEEVYVYRKIVPLEEAEQYDSENELIS